MKGFRCREKKREMRDLSVWADMPQGKALSLTVRRLREEDLPAVVRLHRLRLPIRYSEAFFQQALQNATLAKVACWQGHLVGALICRTDGPDAIHVRSLVAAAPRRRIGTRLLEAMFAQVEEQGISKCRLNVHVKNDAAIALYKSLGYRVKTTMLGYYQNSAERIEHPPDAHLMERVTPGNDDAVSESSVQVDERPEICDNYLC
eukprot:TRINITY_DN18728_c0_g1_i1.p1 TRINITY_DN18728_c0_g1~~TRINITY_DN18728_c0_g1_i1.p1  ORF type:complete len:204 (-),score=23.92 TRINITY_DN18728_c0_g1_i1:195-806(-)